MSLLKFGKLRGLGYIGLVDPIEALIRLSGSRIGSPRKGG